MKKILAVALAVVALIVIYRFEVETYEVTAVVTHMEMTHPMYADNPSCYISVCDGDLADIMTVDRPTFARLQIGDYVNVKVTVRGLFKVVEHNTYKVVGL